MSLDVENEDFQESTNVVIVSPDPLPVEIVAPNPLNVTETNPIDLSLLEALTTSLIALFTGLVVPKSDDISGNATFTIPTNSKNSVTLIVKAGVVVFNAVEHTEGSYTWSAPLLKNLDAMTFDASDSTDAQILSTQIIS